MSVHVAVGVYVDADVAVFVDAHVGVQALFSGPDTCMANLLVHVCVPVLLDSSKALTCTGALHEECTRACRRDLQQTSRKCITTVTSRSCRTSQTHLQNTCA